MLFAVRSVLAIVEECGPFDGIFGFSAGGVVASLVANIKTDPSLCAAVLRHGGNHSNRMRPLRSMASAVQAVVDAAPPTTDTEARGGHHTSAWEKLRELHKDVGDATSWGTVRQLQESHAPVFRFAIIVCAGAPSTMEQLRNTAQLEPLVGPMHVPMEFLTPSFHLIGVDDDAKAQSEEVSRLFRNAQIWYMAGGHGISRDLRSDIDLLAAVANHIDVAMGLVPKPTRPELTWSATSSMSSLAVVDGKQLAHVRLESHTKLSPSGTTIVGALAAKPPDAPLLRVARARQDIATTYGAVLNFFQPGGAGDLRRIGVHDTTEVVAFCAPPGGSAASALAFLSIAAQACAAPLAQNTTMKDALSALEQFNAKFLILFDGVEAEGVVAAFHAFAATGRATLHTAVIHGDHVPGLFTYEDEPDKSCVESHEPLVNPSTGVCLLLCTSGTTSTPKGVPLKQGQIVLNGAILAASIGLEENDICYGIMPLFHIGGLSASVLCSIAVGASITCDSLDRYNPEQMVEALSNSVPRPTWYSSVPTIHNATVAFLNDNAEKYGVHDGVWTSGQHSLRMIRSGAAALTDSDGAALGKMYGGIPILPTYSMSEQMPISQPPRGMVDQLQKKPGSVGVPVAASCAIVSRATLRPQPPGSKGEVAISGSTVLTSYLNNEAADRKAYFYITAPQYQDGFEDCRRYFLTGDVGVLDNEGFLTLTGRAKEMIKKGGEQVSPYEVEEPLVKHPFVRVAVCFAVPSPIYGEEVGCALVLSPEVPIDARENLRHLIAALRATLKESGLQAAKYPTKWRIVQDDELPKTKSQKFIRIGLSTVLGLDPDTSCQLAAPGGGRGKPKLDWAALSGLRFYLSCMVMFMHFGSDESWGAFGNLRQFPWHVHLFFTLGGYTMAAAFAPPIANKVSFFVARLSAMYPLYLLALLLALTNLLVSCRPSTFHVGFHWDSQIDDMYVYVNGTRTDTLQPLFCEGTPLIQHSWWANLFLTLVIYITGLQATPAWSFSWMLGYYLWFSSMFYQCLAIFPCLYNSLYARRGKKTALLAALAVLLGLNVAILVLFWHLVKDEGGYRHFDSTTGLINFPQHAPGAVPITAEQRADAERNNAYILGYYLFAPFWYTYFAVGMCTAFIYDAYRPAETRSAWAWGWVADSITVILLAVSVAHIAQGSRPHGGGLNQHNRPKQLSLDGFALRPDEGDTYTDNLAVARIWDNIWGRLFAPLTTLWVFALSTGRGATAWVFSREFLAKSLAPCSYLTLEYEEPDNLPRLVCRASLD